MKGYKLARHLYRSRSSKEWLRSLRQRSKSPLEFVDVASQHYKNIMEALSPQPRKVLLHILLSYQNGIRCNKLAQKTGYSQSVVASIVGRLCRTGIIQRMVATARSPYSVEDLDFLHVCATRWDHKWDVFYKPRLAGGSVTPSIIDDFIEQQGGLRDG